MLNHKTPYLNPQTKKIHTQRDPIPHVTEVRCCATPRRLASSPRTSPIALGARRPPRARVPPPARTGAGSASSVATRGTRAGRGAGRYPLGCNPDPDPKP